jgi:hypothetical protein
MSTFAQELRHLTQLSYLLATGVSLVKELDPRTISASLQWRVQDLCTDGQTVKTVAMREADVAAARTRMPGFTADILLVYLETLFHSRLADALRLSGTKPTPAIEKVMRRRRPTSGSEWWYRDIVLLAVIRNAVAHANGVVSPPYTRLLAAGWNASDVTNLPCLASRSFADFLHFKRAVRTAANQLCL